MPAKIIKNGINTDFADNTLNTKIETKYSANIGDKNIQTTQNRQIDEQLDSISFSGSVNTGGGPIMINPLQGNLQSPNIESSSNQTISITHGKFVFIKIN